MSEQTTTSQPVPKRPPRRRRRARQAVPRKTLNPVQRWTIGLATLALLLLAYPQIAPGICEGDPGDLQTACATLGITHPPGYAAYVFIGWLACKAFAFADPAYVVNIVCMCSMVAALALIMCLLTRLGLHVAMAVAMPFLMILHPWVYSSLVVPEVYAPSLLCLVGAAYALIRFREERRWRHLIGSAVLLGVLIASRPPSLVFAPGFAIVLILIERHRGQTWKGTLPALTTGCVAVVAPIVLIVGLTVMLDRPNAAYNYISEYAAVHDHPPVHDGTVFGRTARVLWLMTGVEYQRHLNLTGDGIRDRLDFLYDSLQLGGPIVSGVLALIVIVGLLALLRRALDVGVIALTIVIGQAAFLVLYQVKDQAADVLPLLFAAALVAGGASATALAKLSQRWRSIVSCVLALCAFSWAVTWFPRRDNPADEVDATGYLADVDFASLPPNAVVIADWWGPETRPLWYARCVQTNRGDVLVLPGPHQMWPVLVDRVRDRPIFLTRADPLPGGWEVTRHRKLWRLDRWRMPEP